MLTHEELEEPSDSLGALFETAYTATGLSARNVLSRSTSDEFDGLFAATDDEGDDPMDNYDVVWST